MTHCRRPDYSKQVMDALGKCHGIDRYKVIARVEPGNLEVLRVLSNFKACEISVRVNEKQLFCGRNTRKAIEEGFTESDFIVHIEDDTVPAPDCLLFMEHCACTYRESDVFSVAAYNSHQCAAGNEYAIGVRDHFSCWIWGTWIEKYKKAAALLEFNDTPGGAYMNYLFRHTLELGTCREVYPMLSRSQNIGEKDGVHTTPAIWKESHYTPWFAGDKPMKTGLFHPVGEPIGNANNIIRMLRPGQEELLYRYAMMTPKDSLLVEVGSLYGGSSACIASACKGTLRRLMCFDVWAGVEYTPNAPSRISTFLRNMRGCGLLDYITPVMGDSAKTLPEMADYLKAQNVQMFLVDGGHAYSQTKNDLNFALEVVRPGGYILVHDIDPMRPSMAGVMRAWNEVKDKLEVIEQCYDMAVARKKQ